MPKYDLKCRVKLNGKELTGNGVELPASIGDGLVKRKQAMVSVEKTAAVDAPQEAGAATVSVEKTAAVVAGAVVTKEGDTEKKPSRYHSEHRGGGRWYVIDETTGQAVSEALKREEADSKIAELNSGAE